MRFVASSPVYVESMKYTIEFHIPPYSNRSPDPEGVISLQIEASTPKLAKIFAGVHQEFLRNAHRDTCKAYYVVKDATGKVMADYSELEADRLG